MRCLLVSWYSSVSMPSLLFQQRAFERLDRSLQGPGASSPSNTPANLEVARGGRPARRFSRSAWVPSPAHRHAVTFSSLSISRCLDEERFLPWTHTHTAKSLPPHWQAEDPRRSLVHRPQKRSMTAPRAGAFRSPFPLRRRTRSIGPCAPLKRGTSLRRSTHPVHTARGSYRRSAYSCLWQCVRHAHGARGTNVGLVFRDTPAVHHIVRPLREIRANVLLGRPFAPIHWSVVVVRHLEGCGRQRSAKKFVHRPLLSSSVIYHPSPSPKAGGNGTADRRHPIPAPTPGFRPWGGPRARIPRRTIKDGSNILSRAPFGPEPGCGLRRRRLHDRWRVGRSFWRLRLGAPTTVALFSREERRAVGRV